MNDAALPLPSGADAPEQAPSLRGGGGAGQPAVVEASPAIRFRKLVDAHFDFTWRSLRGLGVPLASVDDAAQQVFLIAAQKLDSIALGSERAFLFSTVLGVSANLRRSRARSREVLDDEALNRQADVSPSGEKLLEMREQRALLDQVLASMADDLRTVFVLFVLEGTTAAEIAAMLDLAPGTVASRVRRAREAFHAISKRLHARSVSNGGSR